MNKTVSIDTDYLCFILPIISIMFVFFIFITSNQGYNEYFTSCVDPNSIVIGNNICYSCPIGGTLNNKCTDATEKPLKCMDPNAKLVDNICYGCPDGDIYDETKNVCVNASRAITSTLATSNIHYKCLNDNDILIGKSCYECRGKNSNVNSDTLKCETILKSYLPIDSYVLPTTNASCKAGYFKDFGTCQKCNPDDSYKSGFGCMQLSISKPINIIPAVSEEHPFNPFHFD